MAEAGPEDIPDTYVREAGAWDRGRSRCLFERPWLERATEGLGCGAPVLDLGCGGGEPIAGWLLGRGFAVTGLDIAPPMLALARARFPAADWILGDMRRLALGRRFQAVIAWDSFFHLSAADQRAMFPRFAAHLAPGGRLLFTSGPAAGEAVGRVGGSPVYHASLAPADYARLIESAGLALRGFAAEDMAAGGHTVWLARHPAEAG